MTPNKSDSGELREQLKNYRIINETPVGTKAFPDDLDMRLHNLLSERDFDNLISIVTTHIQTIGEEIIGKKEYYRQHYPFVITEDQHLEAKERIARDDLRYEQRQRLAHYLGKDKE